MPVFSTDHALLADGFHADIRITHEDGVITDIAPGRAAHHIAGATLPGMVNLHSHAFQRSFAGATEYAGGGGDFWSWREAMYQAATTIEPDTMAPIAAYLAMRCLQGGFTSLVEFHYLQNAPDGTPYAHRPAMADAIEAGAIEAGIGLTLLHGLYETANFAREPLQGGQRRFRSTPDDTLRLLADAIPRQTPMLRFGLAPHSLRAVPPAALVRLVRGAATIDPDAPIHIHIAEQRAEVEACIATLGAAPAEWLLANAPVGLAWCLIHSTHTTQDERQALALSGAVAGLCPNTEGNLGDGLFTLPDYVQAGGRFGIGTDSHVCLDAFAELRLLEYTQRLRAERRNVLAANSGHTARILWQAACAGGAQAAGRPVGALRIGARADACVILPTPETEHLPPDFWLAAAVFADDAQPAREVLCNGVWVVRGGAHIRAAEITRAYRGALRKLST